jgi:lipoprotein-anchoring transpeptidase ErfK/SrfK
MNNPAPTAQRSLGSRRGTTSLAAALLCALALCIIPISQASAAKIPVGQALVILSHNKTARTSPSTRAHVLTIVASTRPLTGVRTVLPVLGHVTNKRGRSFDRVRLPGRPNSGSGWISTDGTTPSWTPWRILVNLNQRVLTVYYAGRKDRRFPAIVGKPSTPTPPGDFFIEEGLTMGPEAAGGPYALATSDRSDVYTEFDGGPGQIAIHGMDNLPGVLGTAASHGCIRLDGSDITWLAHHIGPGVPLKIIP